MPTAEWPIVQLTVRLERDQMIGQAMTWKHALTFQGPLTTALSLSEMLVMAQGLKQQRSSSFLPFPKPRQWFGGLGRDVFKERYESVVHSHSASCASCNLTTPASEKVRYGSPCGHFQKLAVGLPFFLHQQLRCGQRCIFLILFLCHRYSMKLLKVDYCAEWSCS